MTNQYYKWSFEETGLGIEKQGIRDNDIQVFDKFRIPSLVRESIQNSLDAAQNTSLPVRVEFEYGYLDKQNYLELFAIEDHIKACGNTTEQGSEDADLISKMLNEVVINQNKVPFIKVSDYNTTGMEKDSSYQYFAFSRNLNFKKEESSAGSKGMGKSAFFSMSYLRTILVSSKHISGTSLFQGISRLASHRLGEKELYFKGFFGKNDFDPDDKPSGYLLENFNRHEPGTSISIIGTWNKWHDLEDEMIKAAIKNFWLALLRKKLVLKFSGLELNEKNIYELTLKYWPDYKGTKSGENINPRQFIETYLSTHSSQTYNDNIDFLGKVELILSKNENYTGKISFFRKSNMLIETNNRGNPNHPGYAGVFICEDIEGNKLLKRLENPRHDQWSEKNFKHPRGAAALRCLKDFIQQCYEDFMGANMVEELSIPRLADFLQLDHDKNNRGKNAGFAKANTTIVKTKKRESIGGGGEKQLGKTICYTSRNPSNQIIYHFLVEAKRDIKQALFEITVGGDSDRAGVDNIIPLSSVKDAIIVEGSNNKIAVDLFTGENSFSVILNDNTKYALKLKLVDA